MRLSKLFLAGLIVLTCPRSATGQAGRADPPRGWTNNYEPKINYEGITRAERAFAMARLAEIERIFHRIPELMTPTEFVVRRQYFGGSRPLMIPNGAAEYSLFIWFFGRFGPREVDGEGCTCIGVTINAGPGSDRSDEHGRPIFMEGDPGEPIPGATVVYAGDRSDVREVSSSVVFTRAGVFPWETVSREEYLRALIHEAEGLKGEKTAGFRKALEQTPYEHWMAASPQRKKDRDDLTAALRRNRTPAEEIAKRIAAMEATEREVTEQLKAQHATDQKTNQEVLARPTYGDQLRAQIEAMSPEERRRAAMVQKDGQLLPLDAPKGNRMLRPKLEFWRVRQSPVEIHSITVSISGSTGIGQANDAVISAIQQTYRNLDWAALKRMVDATP